MPNPHNAVALGVLGSQILALQNEAAAIGALTGNATLTSILVTAGNAQVELAQPLQLNAADTKTVLQAVADAYNGLAIVKTAQLGTLPGV